MTVTQSGLPCQPWVQYALDDYGDEPDEFIDGVFPDNLCRNPSDDPGAKRPWCYHGDTDRARIWQYCDIRRYGKGALE